MSDVRGEIELRDPDPDALADALSPDDTDAITTRSDGDRLVITFRYDDVSRAVNALDDALSCLSTAREVTECI